jgi:integrase
MRSLKRIGACLSAEEEALHDRSGKVPRICEDGALYVPATAEELAAIEGESEAARASRGRPIPLTQPAWAALNLWASRFPERKFEDFVFPACENGQIDPERPIANWRTAWRRACREAGLAGLRFRDLRHTAATKLLEQGMPIAVVAHILAWSASTAIRMAKRYGHIRPEVQRQALDGVATAEIQPTVNQIVHQLKDGVESARLN